MTYHRKLPYLQRTFSFIRENSNCWHYTGIIKRGNPFRSIWKVSNWMGVKSKNQTFKRRRLITEYFNTKEHQNDCTFIAPQFLQIHLCRRTGKRIFMQENIFGKNEDFYRRKFFCISNQFWKLDFRVILRTKTNFAKILKIFSLSQNFFLMKIIA